MSLEKLRGEIDQVDDALVQLLTKRMNLAADVAKVKKSGDAVLVPQREAEVLARVCEQAEPALQTALKTVYGAVFLASRAQQHSLLAGTKETELSKEVAAAVERGRDAWPKEASVACQGIAGAYSHIAARQVFENPRVMSMRDFDAVFRAVEQGLCRYGVLPIENSTYGSVTDVYDLMQKHNCAIVRAARMPIHHCLLSKEVFLKDVKEIWSHEQAIKQCAAFLEKLGDRVQVHVCENTAVAARMAAQSEKPGAAAISSAECAELYGLGVLKDGIHSSPDNETRFIVIAKQSEIYDGANKTSVLVTLQHRTGSLAEMLQLIAGLGINLTKIENRPVGQEYDVAFYLDMECNAQEHLQALEELERHSEKFQFLGSYVE